MTIDGLLHENLQRVEWNRYGLSVFLSISDLYRQNLDMLRSIGGIDKMLQTASESRGRTRRGRRSRASIALWTRPVRSSGRATSAARLAEHLVQELVSTRRRSEWPQILHELDDVKDHLPDRTIDMSYLVYREMLLPFGEWAEQIRIARNQYAQKHQLPMRNDKLDGKI